MMTFGERLREARKGIGLNQTQFAERMGITATRLNYWEKDKRQPDVEMIRALTSALDVTADYLIGNENNAPAFSAEALRVAEQFDGLDEHGKRVIIAVIDAEAERLTDNISTLRPKKVIPLIGASFAAGPGEPDFGNGWEDYEVDADSHAEFALRVNGDSMEPVLHDGQIALGVKRPPEPGEVGVFLLDGTFLVKQCTRDDYGNVYLFSFNPAYDQIDVMASAERSLMCFGTVLLDRR